MSSSSANGEFRLLLDRLGRVSGITCLYSGYLSTENLAQLYKVHSAALPGLFQAPGPEDLFQYFQRPWALALFHDQYEELRDGGWNCDSRLLPYLKLGSV